MVVLLTGASGFIGSHLARALAGAGHTLVLAVHRRAAALAGARMIAVDFVRDTDPALWRARLAHVDVVVNAVGILREHDEQTFARLHRDTPRALFDACVAAQVRQVIQISALGADVGARSRYHASKREADDYLAQLPIASVIVQPSLVYGPGGASARLFDMLASLPLIPVPGDGRMRVQPIHIDDLVDAIVALVGRTTPAGARVPLVGPRPLTLAAFLLRLRETLGFGRGRVIGIPLAVVSLAAALGDRLPHLMLDRETLAMLLRGNTATAAHTHALMGRAPREVDAFVEPAAAPAARTRALVAWQLPLLTFAIALTWIWTGIVSLGLYPVEASYALLARLGITGSLASVMLHGAALLDLALGFAVLFLRPPRWRRLMWRAQILLILAYMALITAGLPEHWLHPFGPIVKNLPLLAATLLASSLEASRWTTSR